VPVSLPVPAAGVMFMITSTASSSTVVFSREREPGLVGARAGSRLRRIASKWTLNGCVCHRHGTVALEKRVLGEPRDVADRSRIRRSRAAARHRRRFFKNSAKLAVTPRSGRSRTPIRARTWRCFGVRQR
jgi:hypothetical protein